VRNDRPSVATFYVQETLAGGAVISLSDSSEHIRARRLRDGDPVRITNGLGVIGAGSLRRSGPRGWNVELKTCTAIARRSDVRLFAPMADRARLLWLAEKATEVGIESWRVVRFRRSESVATKGEGNGFAAKVRARMISALEQSGGAWLPRIEPDVTVAALLERREGTALVLDHAGGPILRELRGAPSPLAIVVGPEGGFDLEELDALRNADWRPVSVGPNVLRFETAGVVAVAVAGAARSAQED
jgi:16S rRNA (uracil1498-N3)-methyltransferase